MISVITFLLITASVNAWYEPLPTNQKNDAGDVLHIQSSQFENGILKEILRKWLAKSRSKDLSPAYSGYPVSANDLRRWSWGSIGKWIKNIVKPTPKPKPQPKPTKPKPTRRTRRRTSRPTTKCPTKRPRKRTKKRKKPKLYSREQTAYEYYTDEYGEEEEAEGLGSSFVFTMTNIDFDEYSSENDNLNEDSQYDETIDYDKVDPGLRSFAHNVKQLLNSEYPTRITK